ncbi:CDP-alcohol phosphatidyltransferase family protein [Flaviflagellibacter deserti]|uniref:CDP-alcohol phosphatidyltransferase family protein n=1 Tax=Flaviflagellibacter deserti TaxID=2267266 RepID=A0ABV9YZK0_9HYPH
MTVASEPSSLGLSTGAALTIGALATPLLGLLSGLAVHGLLVSLFVFVGVGIAVSLAIPLGLPLGLANAITLFRAILTSVLAGLSVQFSIVTEPAAGILPVAIAAFALATDGLDGWIARRSNTISEFGARFDMEVDAFLILVLSVLCLVLGKAGAWILAAGLLRYAFVIAGIVWPALTAPLFPSFRRKAVCVMQVCALIVMLLLEPPLANAIGAITLGALVLSFAIDTAWLLRRTAPAL